MGVAMTWTGRSLGAPGLGMVIRYLLLAWIIPSKTASVIQMPMGDYTKHDICFGKYFKAITKFGKLVLTSSFMFVYRTLDTSDGDMAVKDYCLQKLGWSNTRFKEAFNASERDVLSKNPHADDFTCDISLAFKLITTILGNIIEPLKKDLRDLKNMRNRVCHEDVDMDEAELKDRFSNLQKICRSILEGVGTLSSEDTSTLVLDIEKGLQDLLEAKLDVSDVENYVNDVENFRKEKHSKMITEGRKELMANYSKLKILNPCTWLSDNKFTSFAVDKIFTEIKLMEGVRRVMMNEILNITSLKQRFVARLIIISGVMGAGKTSFHRYILDEWCKRSPTITGLSAIDMVIAIEMRTVSSSSLVQFLREQLLSCTCRSFSESDIIPVLQDMNILFAVDGMDEANYHGRALIREIAHKFTNSYIIVTTRPEHTLELMQMAEDHIVLQIEGFDHKNQIQFVEKVFASVYSQNAEGKEAEAFLEYMSTTCKPLMSHFALPLTLALLLVLWFDDSTKMSSITTITRLHHQIFEMCQQKLVTRLESKGEGHTVSLTRKVRRWVLELGKVAWNMMEEDLLCIGERHANELMDVCEREGLDPIQTMSAFLNCEVNDTITGNRHHFSFHHTSAIEFLAASYVADISASQGSLASSFDEIVCAGYRDLVMYLAGLLKMNGTLNMKLASQLKSVLLCNMNVRASDYNIWWNLLREGEKDQSLCQIVGSIINQADIWTIHSRDSQETTEAKINLLKETGAAPAEVVINVDYTTAFSSCPELQSIVSLLAAAEKTKVKIYLEYDFHATGETEVCDCYLVPLLKGNKLVEFKGHIAREFASSLVVASNVQTLFVRVSCIQALGKLGESMRKHRRWKVKFMPSRRWTLKYVEIFLDLKKDTKLSLIPDLKYHGTLVVKLSGISDSSAIWAGEVLKRLSRQYTSVILQDSQLTFSGMEQLIGEIKGVKIKVFRVMSNHIISRNEVKYLAKKSNINIGWSST
ncbi:uncharacterized protein LOC122253820 [Penaeus japonicus]|uniref:uncharacterized protein LOC122253820 n=1 Tax=Penaeus japonicus TaxID=27405 RepID=UPI001C70D359|nr:uncharacterized protein LOC122253820 [Penaeus japonicus]